MVSLSEAREARDTAKKTLRLKLDPGAVVKAEKIAEKIAVSNTFRAVSAEWLQRKMIAEKKSVTTLARTRWLLDILNDGIGDKPLTEIEAPELLGVLRKVEAQDKLETVKRLRATASLAFNSASRLASASAILRRI